MTLFRVALSICFFMVPTAVFARTFHVDCGSAEAGPGTRYHPWNSLTTVNAHTFVAYDRILFRSGSVCHGQLVLHGSGKAGAPVMISRYGLGPLPVLSADGVSGPVVYLRNEEQWEISAMELRNGADTPADRSGLVAENATGHTLHHLWISGLRIDTVRGWSGGWYSTNAGIGIQTDHTATLSAWDDVRITDNTLRHVDRIAISVTPDHDGEGTGPTTHLVIQNNHIVDSGGDDILVVRGSNTTIAENDTRLGGSRSVHGCPPSGSYCNKASASIWVAGSEHTTIRRNRVVCSLNENDGQAFDVDWGNRDTLIESNLSRNNRGGFLLLMPAFLLRGEPTSLLPSSGTIVRYNVSENDTLTQGCERLPNADGPASVIHLVGDIPNRPGVADSLPLIYNNTILLPSGATANIIGSRKDGVVHGSLVFANNIVVNRGSGLYIGSNSSIFRRNLFWGNQDAAIPASIASIKADPLFAGPFTSAGLAVNAGSFRLLPNSPALRVSLPLEIHAKNAQWETHTTPAQNLGAPLLPEVMFSSPENYANHFK